MPSLKCFPCVHLIMSSISMKPYLFYGIYYKMSTKFTGMLLSIMLLKIKKTTTKYRISYIINLSHRAFLESYYKLHFKAKNKN